jgi:hypothetical protein
MIKAVMNMLWLPHADRLEQNVVANIAGFHRLMVDPAGSAYSLLLPPFMTGPGPELLFCLWPSATHLPKFRRNRPHIEAAVSKRHVPSGMCIVVRLLRECHRWGKKRDRR